MTTPRVLSDTSIVQALLWVAAFPPHPVADLAVEALHALHVARADIRELLNAFGDGRLWSWLNLNDEQRTILQGLADTYSAPAEAP
jgi:hypothetical protein